MMKPSKKQNLKAGKGSASTAARTGVVRHHEAAVALKPSKPVKPAVSLPKSELKSYRKRLEEKKADLMNEVEKRIHEGTSSERVEVMDAADQALDSYESELHFGINDNERKFLEDVEDALVRIEEGTFGVCASCGQAISKERLKAMPSARFCIRCKQAQERARVSS